MTRFRQPQSGLFGKNEMLLNTKRKKNTKLKIINLIKSEISFIFSLAKSKTGNTIYTKITNLRQQRDYLFLHTFSYFHSWDLQLSSVCVIHSNGIIGKKQ
jgi:hypothetical protein